MGPGRSFISFSENSTHTPPLPPRVDVEPTAHCCPIRNPSNDAHVTRTANGGRAYDFKLQPTQGVRRALSPFWVCVVILVVAISRHQGRPVLRTPYIPLKRGSRLMSRARLGVPLFNGTRVKGPPLGVLAGVPTKHPATAHSPGQTCEEPQAPSL
ncbi:hypothetical protein LY76DRAFT_601868 [Colletotrichum caudatum]|nr:hypothetical protein LY76DRAFT_601868 [Colletotrichum caudatum]